MRQVIFPGLLLVLSVAGCGGSSSNSAAIPEAASEMDAELKANMARFLPLVANTESGLLFVLNSGSPMAEGVSVVADTSSGAPPHTYTLSGTYDGNGDDYAETTMSGRVTFGSDPATSWSGLVGQLTSDVALPIIGHVYHSEVDITINSAQRVISGSGTFTEPFSSDVTTMTVPASAPLVVKVADGSPNAVSNACGYSLSGQIRLDVAGPDGTLTSYWNFTHDSASASVTNATFTDASGTTVLPDSSVTISCRSGGSIDDWAGGFDQFWACLPLEWGQARITIAVAAPDTLDISDEDPPGSNDINAYSAALLDGNTHAVRGFFVAGPVGSQYREDFNWTLWSDTDSFSQVSSYEYIEGPNAGSGGICVARARRLP